MALELNSQVLAVNKLRRPKSLDNDKKDIRSD